MARPSALTARHQGSRSRPANPRVGAPSFFTRGEQHSDGNRVAYQPKDGYYRKAKREGYRSRAAYKLLELSRRFRLIRGGNRVVDLGAAPGGWLQVVSELVGPHGRAYGFDWQPIQAFPQKNIQTRELDVLGENSVEEIRRILGRPADGVVSDMAPRLSGIRDADIARSLELIERGYEVACGLLKPGGVFLFKTFTGVELGRLLKEMSRRFENVQRVRTDATRKGSSEIYVVAKGFKGGDETDSSATDRIQG